MGSQQREQYQRLTSPGNGIPVTGAVKMATSPSNVDEDSPQETA